MVECSDDLETVGLLFAYLDAAFYHFDAVPNIQTAGGVVVGLVADGDAYLIGDELDVAVRVVVYRRIDRSAVVVPEHHDELAAEVFGGVLDAAELVVVDHIARNSDHEQLADTGGKDALGNDTGVRARNDYRIRRLPLRASPQPTCKRYIPAPHLGAEIFFVALHESA